MRQNPCALVCSCGAILPIQKATSYFEVFGIDDSHFDIDLINLEVRFKSLQKIVHPDRFSQKSSTEKNISAENSSLINAAYQTLSRPMSRLKYILEMKGRTALSEAKHDKLVDQELLVEVMEVREEIESSAKSRVRLQTIKTSNQYRLDRTLSSLKSNFDAGDMDAVELAAIRLQYYTTIEADIDAALEACH